MKYFLDFYLVPTDQMHANESGYMSSLKDNREFDSDDYEL